MRTGAETAFLREWTHFSDWLLEHPGTESLVHIRREHDSTRLGVTRRMVRARLYVLGAGERIFTAPLTIESMSTTVFNGGAVAHIFAAHP